MGLPAIPGEVAILLDGAMSFGAILNEREVLGPIENKQRSVFAGVFV